MLLSVIRQKWCRPRCIILEGTRHGLRWSLPGFSRDKVLPISIVWLLSILWEILWDYKYPVKLPKGFWRPTPVRTTPLLSHRIHLRKCYIKLCPADRPSSNDQTFRVSFGLLAFTPLLSSMPNCPLSQCLQTCGDSGWVLPVSYTSHAKLVLWAYWARCSPLPALVCLLSSAKAAPYPVFWPLPDEPHRSHSLGHLLRHCIVLCSHVSYWMKAFRTTWVFTEGALEEWPGEWPIRAQGVSAAYCCWSILWGWFFKVWDKEAFFWQRFVFASARLPQPAWNPHKLTLKVPGATAFQGWVPFTPSPAE